MKPILWFVLGLVVAISGQAVAQSIYDGYGNSLDMYRGVSPTPGQPTVRDSRGYLYSVPEAPQSSHRSPC